MYGDKVLIYGKQLNNKYLIFLALNIIKDLIKSDVNNIKKLLKKSFGYNIIKKKG